MEPFVSAERTPTPTPTEARAALAQAERNGRRDVRDAWVHALACAGTGLFVGVFVVLNEFAQGTTWWVALLVLYVLALVGLGTWEGTASRSAPRHSKRIGYVTTAATMALAVVAIALLNAWGHDERPALWLALVCATVVPLPMLVGAALILRRARR